MGTLLAKGPLEPVQIMFASLVESPVTCMSSVRLRVLRTLDGRATGILPSRVKFERNVGTNFRFIDGVIIT